MKKLYELKERLCDELESYADKGVNSSTIQAIDTLAHAAKNVGKIIEDAEEQEYSGRGSYNNDGGSYARGRGNMRMSNAQRRDSRGRYSSADGYSRTHEMVEELRDLMEQAPENTKGEFKRFIERVEMM